MTRDYVRTTDAPDSAAARETRPITHGTFARTVDAVDSVSAQLAVMALAKADPSVERVLDVSGVRLATPVRPSSRLARYRVELIVEARPLVPAEDCE